MPLFVFRDGNREVAISAPYMVDALKMLAKNEPDTVPEDWTVEEELPLDEETYIKVVYST
jgi:hypothetical protein